MILKLLKMISKWFNSVIEKYDTAYNISIFESLMAPGLRELADFDERKYKDFKVTKGTYLKYKGSNDLFKFITKKYKLGLRNPDVTVVEL